MPPLFTCHELGKSFSSQALFEGISFSVQPGERVGVLGPNGAGKSTLLRIIAGLETADEGRVSYDSGSRFAYLHQYEEFPEEATVEAVLRSSLTEASLSEDDIRARLGTVRSVLGFSDLDAKFGSLSGGWKKRLAIGTQLVKEPDVLFLDEPTNHLDLEGIAWLERFMKSTDMTLVVISHDRMLLENVATRIFEINRVFPKGFFTMEGNYSRFLEKRGEYLEGLKRYEDSLRNKVRREVEWLRQGVKARGTKSRGRIQEAERLIDELKESESRSGSRSMKELEFSSGGKRAKKLILAEKIGKSYADKILFQDIEILLSPGTRLGIVGANGSGKSTLLKILSGALQPDSGVITRAPELRLVTFEQDRSSLDKNQSLRRALAPDSDTVIYRGEPQHVVGWARRFLFKTEQLDTPIRSLSGGEQARLLISKLMLQPADILFLDEPTNDLDIETLQILEESLEDFPGAVVLITHDRFMLDRVSTRLLGLDGSGKGTYFSSFSQWEEFLRETRAAEKKAEKTQTVAQPQAQRKKLSYNEQRELGGMEKHISDVEERMAVVKETLLDPAIANDGKRITEFYKELHELESQLEKLFERWSELSNR